jgi:microcystin-dependent protein
MTPYIAQIMQVGFNFAPPDWMQAAGQTLAISQNTALFSLIGTTFGGNGTTTFQLPNLMSRVVVGVGQTAGLSNYVWGQVGGMEQVTLNQQQMPTHTHVATFTPPTATLQAVTGATGTTAQSSPSANARLCNTFDNAAGGGSPQIYLPTGGTPVNLGGLSVTGGSVTNGLAGGNLPTPILQPYLALYTLIAISGYFPSRG